MKSEYLNFGLEQPGAEYYGEKFRYSLACIVEWNEPVPIYLTQRTHISESVVEGKLE